MSRKRLRVECYFSVNEHNREAIGAILAIKLSERFGGCTISSAAGFWMADGNDTKQKYEGPLEENISLHLVVTVMPEEKTECIDLLKKAVADIGMEFGNLSAVHVEAFESEAFHFVVCKANLLASK